MLGANEAACLSPERQLAYLVCSRVKTSWRLASQKDASMAMSLVSASSADSRRWRCAPSRLLLLKHLFYVISSMLNWEGTAMCRVHTMQPMGLRWSAPIQSWGTEQGRDCFFAL